MTIAIEARNVGFSFGTTPALRGATIAVDKGEILAIMGPSGSGKSTLLHCLAGILVPDSGEVRFAGDRIDSMTETQRSSLRRDRIVRVDVAATGPSSPTPIGIPKTPGPGEFYASPALAKLLATSPAAELADRYPGRDLGTIGPATLTSPDSLLVIVGRTPAEAAKLPNVRQLTSVGDNAPALPETVVDLILGVIAGGLLFPVLIFIGTATRLSAARREQRFAAMRLVGATSRQISVIAATEAAAAAIAGTALGFALFFAFRGQLAGIPFTGMRFFPEDIVLTPLDALVVLVGVPAGAALAAWVSLRRVRISPLGVTRRVTPRPPSLYRLTPLVLGVAGLGLVLVIGPPDTSDGQTAVFLPGLLLIMTGLVLAGPLLTMAGARVLARRANRPATLIAARRLADNPKAGFRAISGIMLALFVTSVALGVITTIVANRGPAPIGSTDAGTLSTSFYHDPPVIPGTLLTDLRAIPGVRSATVVHSNPVKFEPGLIACTDIPKAYGRCADGATVAAVADNFIPWRESASATRVWPAASVSPNDLHRLPVQSIVVDTGGTAAALERSRTVLSLTFPNYWAAPNTPGEFESDFTDQLRGWQQLANVIIIASLGLAGCSLAVSVIGGLSERRRPFSLLRLSGTPVQTLRRVVALESAVPMLAVSVVAIGMGLLAAQLFLKAQMGYTLSAPGVGFYAVVIVGLAACLGIIASTLPLLERITGPETARSE